MIRDTDVSIADVLSLQVDVEHSCHPGTEIAQSLCCVWLINTSSAEQKSRY